MAKYNRNSLCWCGSGKKHKLCHLNREEKPKLNPWLVADQLRKSFSAKQCLSPECEQKKCNGKIVSAHTVSKKSGLQPIAEDGHIYFFDGNFAVLKKTGGKPMRTKIGINKASTFNGFCAYHDKELFSCFEDEEFSASEKQIFMLTFRSLAKEMYGKNALGILPNIIRDSDRGRNIIAQHQIQTQALFQTASTAAAQQDFKLEYDLMSASYQKEDFANISSVVVEFDNLFPIAAAGATVPDHNLDGARIQDLGNLSVRAQHLILSTISSKKKTWIILAWLPIKENPVLDFIRQLTNLSSESLVSYLVYFIYANFENHFTNISWLKKQSSNANNALQEWMMLGLPVQNAKDIGSVDETLLFNSLPNITSVKIKE